MIAMREATDGESCMRAVFRLLLATVQAEYAVAHFHSATVYKYLTAEITAGRLPRVGLSSWALTPEEDWWKSANYELYMKPCNWRYAAALFYGSKHPRRSWELSIRSFAPRSSPTSRRRKSRYSKRSIRRSSAPSSESYGSRKDRAALLMRDLPFPAILLSWDLEAIFHNRPGIESCAAWRNGAVAPTMKNERIELPEELLTACAEMKYAWRRSLESHNLKRVAMERSITHPASCLHTANIRMMRS
jgi:hypothetical protein